MKEVVPHSIEDSFKKTCFKLLTLYKNGTIIRSYNMGIIAICFVGFFIGNCVAFFNIIDTHTMIGQRLHPTKDKLKSRIKQTYKSDFMKRRKIPF